MYSRYWEKSQPKLSSFRKTWGGGWGGTQPTNQKREHTDTPQKHACVQARKSHLIQVKIKAKQAKPGQKTTQPLPSLKQTTLTGWKQFELKHSGLASTSEGAVHKIFCTQKLFKCIKFLIFFFHNQQYPWMGLHLWTQMLNSLVSPLFVKDINLECSDVKEDSGFGFGVFGGVWVLFFGVFFAIL